MLRPYLLSIHYYLFPDDRHRGDTFVGEDFCKIGARGEAAYGNLCTAVVHLRCVQQLTVNIVQFHSFDE